MIIEVWLAFVAASCVLLVIPGPTILTVISYSATQGQRARLPLVAAVALGDTTALLFSLLGLGALLATSAFWFTAIKWAGGLYLLYLGIRMLRAADFAGEELATPAPVLRRKLFADTYLVTALNPKGIIFFVAFLPQFIHPSASLAPQFFILGSTFVILAALSTTAYAIFAASARGFLTSARAQRRFSQGGGALMSAAGVWALMARRPI